MVIVVIVAMVILAMMPGGEGTTTVGSFRVPGSMGGSTLMLYSKFSSRLVQKQNWLIGVVSSPCCHVRARVLSPRRIMHYVPSKLCAWG